jgi:5-methylcytosine-specific restriction protein B
MLDINALTEIICAYKQNFQRIHKEEIYKWKAVKCFQDNWDIGNADFLPMLERALAKANNLLVSQNFYPKGMICTFAEKDPEAVRAMFIELFDEAIPVIERMEGFTARAEELRLKYGGGAWKQHYQTTNSISVYLFLHSPDKYFIFKYRKFKGFAERITYPDIPKMGKTAGVQSYFNMCNEVLGIVKLDAELLNLSKDRLTEEDYSDDDYHVLTEDIVFFGSRPAEATNESWWPSEEEYQPGINKERWLQLLADNAIFTTDSKAIMKRMLAEKASATCTQLSRKYGESKDFYNRGSSELAKRVWQATDCNRLTNNNENAQWWPILYTGRYADKGTAGGYIWKLRPELEAALNEADLSEIPLHSEFSETSNGQVNHWWLNANPKIWSFSAIRVGEEQGYTLLNENGNKRRIFQNFLDAKADDLVIGYESTPVRQIAALCKISRENDGESLYFEKVEGLTTPIEYGAIKDITELKSMEYLVNPQGGLFKLTKDEYDLLLDIIREQNPAHPRPDAVQKVEYKKEHFLRDVYISEDDYDSLTSLLLHKKNIILQGAPGVGKTYAAKRLAYSILESKDDDKIKIVQFHQSYTYEDFIMGYKPGDAGFKMQTGVFYQFCQQAENRPDDMFFFIIDEINRGNLSKIFGELLMLVEKDYRGEKMTMAYGGLTFSVPENLYIIGMMNTADRSLAMIDYALRRRFSFFDMRPAFYNDTFVEYQRSLANEVFDNLIETVKRLNQDIANDASLGDGFCIGHSYFCDQTKESCTDEWLSAVIEYDLIPMINEYWFDDKAKVQIWAARLRGVLNG